MYVCMYEGKNLLKLSDIMSYVKVVNRGHNEETQDKCRGREATEVSTEREWQCIYIYVCVCVCACVCVCV